MTEQIIEIPEGYSEEDINEALQLLESKRTKKATQKQKREEKMQDPEYGAKQKTAHLRYQAKRNILIRMAIEAGFKVTDEMIDAELAEK